MNVQTTVVENTAEEYRVLIANATQPTEQLRLLDELSAYLSQADPAQGIEYAKKELEIAAALKDKRWVAAGSIRLADCARLLTDYGIARRHLKKAQRLLEAMDGSFAEKSRLYRSLGKLSTDHNGDTLKAMDWYHLALESAQESGDPREIALSLLYLGESFQNIGETDKAVQLVEQSLEISEVESFALGKAMAHRLLGRLSSVIGQWENAVESFTQSLAVCKTIGSVSIEASIYDNLAFVYTRQDKLTKALGLYQRAVRLYESMGDKLRQTFVLMNIGHVHAAQGDHESALECMEEVVAFGRTFGNPVIYAFGLLGRGENYMASKQWVEAVDVLSQALTLTKQAKLIPQQYRVINLLAQAYEGAGDVGKALSLYRQNMLFEQELVSNEIRQKILGFHFNRQTQQAQREIAEWQAKLGVVDSESERRSKEVQNLAIRVARNQEFLAQLRKRLLGLDSGDAEVASLIKTVVSQIDENTHYSHVWHTFEERLGNLDEEFVHTLLASFPSLTPAEVRICSLLRINMSNKEIAAILNVSTRTLDAQRLSVRKKLNLKKNQHLTAALCAV